MQFTIPVKDGLEFQEFKAYLEGFQDGVAAAVERAIKTRMTQLSKPAPSPAAAPPAATGN